MAVSSTSSALGCDVHVVTCRRLLEYVEVDEMDRPASSMKKSRRYSYIREKNDR